MAVTRQGKPTAWIVAQLVEQENGDVHLYLSRSGPSHDEAEMRNVEVEPIVFKHTTGQSGSMAHEKPANIIKREQ